ncbi:hypothetical protein A5886_001680 [Enterococcus sp. 8G7_MSG3316]|uniref:Viral A-type inclusion protein n=1 Tax=Candidatus Enterococcus testudinis TaxID=1834191 RepID=A0A242A7L5_9ENTE|nr:hypothetical protein [Enterococcus sp. 8G7_MSG3316]OTN76603.1 hypothetical protein A5886_001680 [Enterococcus sp. 8G7_MSG3316]
MTDEGKKEQEVMNENFSNSEEATFTDIKQVASKNIGQMLQDLQDFESAIEKEDIPEIYRIYNGRLHKQLKETSNQNHEIDELLARKIHDHFTFSFPFMLHCEKVSPTVHYYKIGTYFHERPTIGIDASIPEIFVIPEIDDEWDKFQRGNRDMLTTIEKQIDQLEAKRITAMSEVKTIQDQIDQVAASEAELNETKSFFNRTKIDEELEQLTTKRKSLEEKRKEWERYTNNEEEITQEKERLQNKYQKLRLKKAIVEKEFRQIDAYFGSFEDFSAKLMAFLNRYTGKELHELDE